ncbi:hypothetical protein JHK82_013019 [Glycine max]|nr:hypothetical protein JHK82_013019 [Glycine max]
MDTVPRYRKRNQPSGTLTRTRSQLYHHRNRSGQLRFDPVPVQDEPYAELLGFRRINCKKPKRHDDELPRPPTKDLRARRVYSPPQSTNPGLIESTFPKGSAEATESPDLGLFCEARGFGGDCSEKIDGLDGATTLLDVEICGGSNSKVNEDVGKLEAEVPAKDTPCTGNVSSLKSKFVKNSSELHLFLNIIVTLRTWFYYCRVDWDLYAGTPKLGFCQKDEEGRQGFQLPLSSQSQEESKQELKTDATAYYGVKDVASDLHNDDLKQLSSHGNNLDRAEASTAQEFGILNEECIQTTPPDADICVNSEVNVKPMDFTRSTPENAGEGSCLKADKGKYSLKSKSLIDFADASKSDHQDEANMHAKSSQLPLSSQSEEASIDEHKTNSSPMHGTVESNGLETYVLVNPSNELSHGNQPKLAPSQDLPELSTQLDAKEVVCGDLSAPSVNEHTQNFAVASKDECLSASELNPCSVMVDDFHSAKNVAHNDGIKEVQNKISRQHNNESPPKDQNMLYINGDVSELTYVHHSSKEKGFTIAYDESKQSVNLEEHESVSRFSPECQTLSQLDPNVLDAEENVTSLNHVRVSNDIFRAPPENITSEKSDMAGDSGDKAGSVQNGIVLCSSRPSKGSDNQNASEIENGSESKITSQQTGLQACDLNNDSSQIPEYQSSHDSCNVIQLQDEQVILNGLCKPESSTDTSISVHGIDLPITTLAPMINKVTNREEKAPPISSMSLSVFSEVKGNNSFLMPSNEKLPETHECCQSLSQLQVVEQLRVPAIERAFEFSKNQLLDAEEVKEACRKACAAEEVAKDRLSQMHDDLNTHCRITSLQPPTVTFAVPVEEKVIQPGG